MFRSQSIAAVGSTASVFCCSPREGATAPPARLSDSERARRSASAWIRGGRVASRFTPSTRVGGGTIAAGGLSIPTGAGARGEPRRSNEVRRMAVKPKTPTPASAITSVVTKINRRRRRARCRARTRSSRSNRRVSVSCPIERDSIGSRTGALAMASLYLPAPVACEEAMSNGQNRQLSVNLTASSLTGGGRGADDLEHDDTRAGRGSRARAEPGAGPGGGEVGDLHLGERDPRVPIPRPPDQGKLVMMGPDPRLAQMPAKPTLIDYFKYRFGPANHLLQSARLAQKSGAEREGHPGLPGARHRHRRIHPWRPRLLGRPAPGAVRGRGGGLGDPLSPGAPLLRRRVGRLQVPRAVLQAVRAGLQARCLHRARLQDGARAQVVHDRHA